MTWKVTAPLVLARTESGQTQHVYAGGVIDWLSDEQKAYFLAEGLVTAVAATATAAASATGDGDGERPHAAATKAELVEWLVDNAEHGDGSPYTEAELRPHTKDQLWELIDAAG